MMGIKYFTEEEIEYLSSNIYVESVNEKQITYTIEFKQFFVREYMNGKGPTLIFESVGLYKRILGAKRIEKATSRWMKAYENGTLDVSATLLNRHPVLKAKNITDKELIRRQEAKIKLLELEVELLKKIDLKERGLIGSQRLKSSDIFELIRITIRDNNLKNVVSYLCASAGVSRSGYYNYLSNESKRERREEIDIKVRDDILMAISFRGYKKGSRSIKMLLEDKFGICYNRKRIMRIMRKYNIVCPIRRKKYKYKVTKEHKVCKNYLQREFKQNVPGKVMLTDISYLQYGNAKTAYLSTILDASTNEILSFKVRENMKLDLVISTLNELKDNQFVHFDDGMIHSDQGWHYTNPQFRIRAAEMGLQQSMSRRGNCWDNAPQESFFGHLKDEVDIKHCNTFDELHTLISDYIDYYNNDRYQWNLNKMTPIQYRNYLLNTA
jgi:putative transposase